MRTTSNRQRVRIRRIKVEDYTPLLDIQIASMQALGTEAYSAEAIELICTLLSWNWEDDEWRAWETFLAEANGAILGFGQFNVAEASIEALYVQPECSGKSIGRTLLGRIERRARQVSIARVELVSSANAVGFYERCGYRIQETIHCPTLGGIDLNMFQMTKRL